MTKSLCGNRQFLAEIGLSHSGDSRRTVSVGPQGTWSAGRIGSIEKRRIRTRFVTVTILAIVSLTAAWGQTCSNDTTHGTYGFVCSGFISPAPNTPQVPFSALGTVSATFGGVFTGSAKASIGGTIVNWSVVGTQNLSSDCTGTITYDQKFDGKAAPPITINYQVLDAGKEIRGMPVDPGATIVCSLKLMTRQ